MSILCICWHVTGRTSRAPFDSFAVLTQAAHSNILFVFCPLRSCNRLRFMMLLRYRLVEFGHIWWISYLYRCARQTAGSCWSLPPLNFPLCNTYLSICFQISWETEGIKLCENAIFFFDFFFWDALDLQNAEKEMQFFANTEMHNLNANVTW